jgi:hypothetical protein
MVDKLDVASPETDPGEILTIVSELRFRSPEPEEDVNITLDRIFLAIFKNQNSSV